MPTFDDSSFLPSFLPFLNVLRLPFALMDFVLPMPPAADHLLCPLPACEPKQVQVVTDGVVDLPRQNHGQIFGDLG